MTFSTLHRILIAALVFYYFPLLIVLIAALATHGFLDPAFYGSYASNLCSTFDVSIKPLLRVLIAAAMAVYGGQLRKHDDPISKGKLLFLFLFLGGIVSLVLNSAVTTAEQPIKRIIFSDAYVSLLSATRGYMTESLMFALTLLGFGFVDVRLDTKEGQG